MRPIIIGTAGHIDHGKSALVKALTGADPDRLLEEKQRGMTIDIGFAFLNENIALIDVPGHERFVKNMVTGASTIDTALLVVAADDGIMPQTKEHFDILRLLKIPRGVIAITKIDLVEPDWIDLVEKEIRELVNGSFLENAPIFRVSAITNAGIEELKNYLLTLPNLIQRQSAGREIFRLPVDRVFVMTGYGTVVTGSVLGGTVAVGDELEILPIQRLVKVRGIQSHNRAVTSISAGHRAALNIQGIEAKQLRRGFELATPDYFQPTKLLSCSVTLLPTAPPVKSNTQVRLHLGTAEYLTRIRSIGRNGLSAGETGIAQLVLDEPVTAGFRDNFIIRQCSPMITIGGGVVLETQPVPLRQKDVQAAASLQKWTTESIISLIQKLLTDNPLQLYQVHQLATIFSCHDDEIRDYLIQFEKDNNVVQIERFWNSTSQHEELKNKILHLISDYHREESLSSGITKAAIGEKLQLSPVLVNFLLKRLAAEERVKIAGDKVALTDFEIQFSLAQQKFLVTLETTLNQAEFNPMDLQEIQRSTELSAKEVWGLLAYLVDKQRVIQIDKDKFLAAEIVNRGAILIRDYLLKQRSATVSELKTILNTSRKWAVPLLNYYDKIGLTIRIGDQRVLNEE
jgi:selenocysteine-specific elongation factor